MIFDAGRCNCLTCWRRQAWLRRTDSRKSQYVVRLVDGFLKAPAYPRRPLPQTAPRVLAPRLDRQARAAPPDHATGGAEREAWLLAGTFINLSTQLQKSGVDLVVLDQNIDTSVAMGRMFFQILGSIAEFEHVLTSERTLDGLAAARVRGRTGGQKPELTARRAKIAQEIYEETGPAGRRAHCRPDCGHVRRHRP